MKLLLRNLEIEFVVYAMHGEHPTPRARVARNDAVVWARLRSTTASGAVAPGSNSGISVLPRSPLWRRSGFRFGRGGASGSERQRDK